MLWLFQEGGAEIHRSSGLSGLRGGSRIAPGAEHADDCIRRVFANHVRRVDHVELLGGVLASKGNNGELAARMILQEVCDIKDLSVHCDPAICSCVVFRQLLHGDASSTATATATATCCGHRSGSSYGCGWS